MPIYEYEPEGPGCPHCQGGFEAMHPRGERLEACPECGTACHRVISAVRTFATDAQITSDARAAEHGFSKYRKVESGRYEKISGDGPSTLNRPPQ